MGPILSRLLHQLPPALTVTYLSHTSPILHKPPSPHHARLSTSCYTAVATFIRPFSSSSTSPGVVSSPFPPSILLWLRMGAMRKLSPGPQALPKCRNRALPTSMQPGQPVRAPTDRHGSEVLGPRGGWSWKLEVFFEPVETKKRGQEAGHDGPAGRGSRRR